MDKPRYENYRDLPEQIQLIYIEELEARWKNRKLNMTLGEPWADGIAAAFLSSLIAIPFLSFAGESTDNIGPGALFFGVLAFFVSRQRHKSYWKDRKMSEEFEKQAFIDRVNAGEFSVEE